MSRPASRRTSSSSMRRVLFLALGLLCVLIILLICLSPPPEKSRKHGVFRSSSTTHDNVDRVVPNVLLQRNKRHRIAILIPFAGDGIESVPPYFHLFCTAASGSSELVDFLIIHNGSLSHLQNLPSNVILIDLTSTQQMAAALLRVTDRRNLSQEVYSTLEQVLTKQLQKYPYILVEYKPALGHVFQSYLKEYSHWGYSDFDIIFGDLPKWISQKELTQYDIVTYGYGDQDRVYLRGQFTFHKNIDKVNQAWRDCEYLSKLDERFAKLLSGENKHFSLESAEGCYSSVVLQRNDLSVKYAVKAFTDVDKHDPAHSHGVYLGLQGQTSVVYKHGHPTDTGVLSTSWLQDESYQNSPLQWEVGEKELVTVNPNDNPKKKKCMYWALEKYQTHICVPGLASTETIFLESGKLYKQSFENSKFPNDILTAPFFHFQEWKRFYRTTQLTACRRDNVNACVLTKEGAIPLVGATSTPMIRPTSPLGLTKMSSNWKGDIRQLLPLRAYCLKSSARTFPPIPPTAKCDLVAYWQDTELMELLSTAPAWKRLRHEETSVTLAMTVQITSTECSSPQHFLKPLLDIVLASMEHWNDAAPCVLVMDVAGVTDEAMEMIREVFSNGRFDSCLVAAMFRTNETMVSRNTLINMARDVAPTRWTLSGIEVERGLILSREARLFAQRSAEAYSESSGSVLLVPQFSITNNNDEKDEAAPTLSVTSLLEMEEANNEETTQTTVVGPDRMDCGFCEDDEDGSDDVLKLPYKVWFELTRRQVTGEFPGHDRLSEVAADLERFQQSLLSLLTSPQLDEMQSIHNSPILLIDNVGPSTSDGTRTFELAREVEEFGGMQCYNGLLLAQLAALGYDVNVLPGAFAASTKSTRQSACRRLSQQNGTPGTTRCDGCFMFDKEQQEKILMAIAQDERVRPAKAALLWQAASE